jgi:RNA polymerase-binding transcription factor DksA
MLNQRQQEKIRKRLLDRLDELRADIQRELRKYDAETYGQIADRVADPAERSVADLLVDINVAEIDRDVGEFREIEAALLRLARGGYGLCVDCEEPVEKNRLDLNPAAARCYKCQQAFEDTDRRVHHRTL